MRERKISNPKGRLQRRPLVVSGALLVRATIPSWELELVEPALAQLADDVVMKLPELVQESGHEKA